MIEKKGEGLDFTNFAWPTEQRFWDDLMYNSSQWGLFMYEQDWLDTEYDNMKFLNYNASAARTWLMQMGTAAARNDLTIQYCMSHCRHIMQSVEIPAVTNARASGDYHAGSDQWQPLGTTGIFAWAVAIAPTKDNYWSTDVQIGTAYHDFATIKEPYNRLQAVVSTISKGPVAPSDKVGRSDAALILKSCMQDGRLLQGDKPAMVIDSSHVQQAFLGGGGGGHSHEQECRVTVSNHTVALSKSSEGYSAWVPMNKKSGGGYAKHDGDFCDCDGGGNCGHWAYHSTHDDFAMCEKQCAKLKCDCFDWMGSSAPPPPAPGGNTSAVGPQGEVWVTHTTIGEHTFGVAMAAVLKADYDLSIAKDMGMAIDSMSVTGIVHCEKTRKFPMSDLVKQIHTGSHQNARLAAFYRCLKQIGPVCTDEANATGTISRSPTIALKICDKWDFQLHAVAPVMVRRTQAFPLMICQWEPQVLAHTALIVWQANGWALLGEPDKWVPVSNARFRDLAYESDGGPGDVTSASVTVVGVEGEDISVAWLAPTATAPTVVVCTVARGSAVSVRVSTASPKGTCVPI